MSTPPDPPIVPFSAGRWHRIWRVARFFVSAAAIGAAIWAVSGKTDELQGATGYLSHMHWAWVGVAVGAEMASYLAYASLQKRLLRAGGVRVSMVPVTGFSLAASAIQNSLPGGAVFGAAYLFRQYKRFGSNDILAGWTLVAFNAVSLITLAAISAVGLALALSAGSTYDLVEAIIGIVLVAMLVVLLWAERIRILPHAARALRLSQRLFKRPRPELTPEAIIARWLDTVSAISPTRKQWARASTMAACNWLADMGCLGFAFFAVGAGVPWRGLVLAYGAAQLATNLPITPGGLGVVEGSLTIALVNFGGGEASTVAAVLLYRLISYWLLLPVGWGSWGAVALGGRSQKRELEPVPA